MTYEFLTPEPVQILTWNYSDPIRKELSENHLFDQKDWNQTLMTVINFCTNKLKSEGKNATCIVTSPVVNAIMESFLPDFYEQYHVIPTADKNELFILSISDLHNPNAKYTKIEIHGVPSF